MPYILSPIISLNTEALWGEGPPYTKQEIYKIEENKLPPVNYSSYTIKPHSLTHVESSKHTHSSGETIDSTYKNPNYYFGKVVVLKLKGDLYKLINKELSIFHWEVTTEQIQQELKRLNITQFNKIIITTENTLINKDGFHNPNYVLTLSQSAADYLISIPNFNLYGTSWKSSDYSPNSKERPIHKTLFKKAIILECLKLDHVPEGEYFLVAFPLPLEGASESPVVPVLFSKNEIVF
jgi:arylformamidase